MSAGPRAIPGVALALLLAHALSLGLLDARGAGPAISDGLQLAAVLLAAGSCLAGNGTPFLQKPFTSEVLLRKVRQVLNQKVAI